MRDSIVSGPGQRRFRLHAGECVGREAGPLLDCDAHLVLPVDVVRGEGGDPVRLGLGGGQVAVRLLTRTAHRFAVVEAARFQPGQAVDARKGAEVRVGQAHRRYRAAVLERPFEHVAAVGRENQFEQEAGEAALRLDHGNEAAGGQLEAFEQALPVQQDFAGEPVITVREQEGVVGRDVVEPRPRR